MILFGLLCGSPIFAESEDIALPAPALRFNVDLREALQLRQSTRAFKSAHLPLEALSLLLWSADGINRSDGKRTAPSAYNTQCIRIYLANDRGFFQYDAKSHSLRKVGGKNIKELIAPANSYAAAAPVVLLLTAEISGFPADENRSSRINLASASAGFVGQNIYLAAAALKLGTTYAAGLDMTAIKKELTLPEDEIPLAIMPVGYPDSPPTNGTNGNPIPAKI
jgi:nitroreductase